MYATTLEEIKEWAIEAHSSTNHSYDDELPYSFHLKAVERELIRYAHLLDPTFTTVVNASVRIRQILAAGWCHDTIEDTRKNYNAILAIAGFEVAEMVRAVTNYGRGRDRDERMPDYIYAEIRNTYDADYLKLGDRIANIKYSIFTESGMYKKYQKEHEYFITNVTSRKELLKPMLDKLTELVNG